MPRGAASASRPFRTVCDLRHPRSSAGPGFHVTPPRRAGRRTRRRPAGLVLRRKTTAKSAHPPPRAAAVTWRARRWHDACTVRVASTRRMSPIGEGEKMIIRNVLATLSVAALVFVGACSRESGSETAQDVEKARQDATQDI